MKSVIPLALLRKHAREKKDKEQKNEQVVHPDPTVQFDAERKKSRYDKYSR